MAELADRHCVPCEKGTPPLARAQAEALARELTGWAIEDEGSHLRLVKTFRFKGFMPGVECVQKIAALAETERHHPDLLLSYGSLAVQLWTHAAGGLTDKTSSWRRRSTGRWTDPAQAAATARFDVLYRLRGDLSATE